MQISLLHSTLHTVHCTVCTLCTLHIAHFSLSAVLCSAVWHFSSPAGRLAAFLSWDSGQCSTGAFIKHYTTVHYSVLYTVQYSVCCTLYSTVCAVHCTLQCVLLLYTTVCAVHCTVELSLNSIHCILQVTSRNKMEASAVIG